MTKEARKTPAFGRRDLLKAAGLGTLAVAGLVPGQAAATPEDVAMQIDEVTKGAQLKKGKIKLDLPDIAENAATVRTTVTVDSPMTPDDYVKAIHLFGEGNPNPTIVTFNLTPNIAKAEATTRIRLAKTQKVVAVAVMSDGSAYTTSKEVKVTIGGCG